MQRSMETAAISHRVADFLKQYAPFHEMHETDLLALAKHGRVRFYERHQYVLAQGSLRAEALVIQQGTVLLWDERSNEARLLDVRGAGDLLGVDQVNNDGFHPCAARSISDVLVYAFPSLEFSALVDKYPAARDYVSAYGTGTRDYRSAVARRDPENIRLADLVSARNIASCGSQVTIRDASKILMESGKDVLVVSDSQRQACTTITAATFLDWIATGDANRDKPVSTLPSRPIVHLGDDATVADAVLAIAREGCEGVSTTEGIVTSQDVGKVFGDRPIEILKEISNAVEAPSLRVLNQRARSMVQRYLNNDSSVDWLAGFTSHLDAGIVYKVISMLGANAASGCWCVSGSPGRGENLTAVMPRLVLITEDNEDPSAWRDTFHRVEEFLQQCGYLPPAEAIFESSFYASGVSEWTDRYNGWVRDPILKMFYQARPLFDLCPVYGDSSLFLSVERTVTAALSPEFLHVIANDCLSTIPPLTFFKNAVVDEVGEETSVFRLEEDALRPLVDVGRVFGLASKKVFRTSTLERFELASTLLPEQSSIFREAAQALRVLLWQQGRAGIGQGNSGAEVPPALLGPYDRQLLKKGFRSILRLIEFTGDLEWLKRL
jgi:CBS domain-containing protein